ncbi:Uma2 family endonuclease [Dyadobacter sp. CY312]|uniref:Uma2 family endonuclease n=1 Tax=Dyadobacter sp. CY312 TaxID=2907303 RepID=UPI001F2A0E89|nr:Uma2 family endonuclease [Dyadobacter sp. CY312]MCE7042148.1 Uma2 family endonuclease [Dyadobacter sp. CY312]
MNNRILSELLNEPNAHFLLLEVEAILNTEKEKRIQFHNNILKEEKVEFINGEIVVHSPVKKRHNTASGLLYRLISIFAGKNDLGFVGIEKIMITLTRNDYEPDICFFKKEKSQHFTEDQILFPAPDLVIEILSDSTEDRDRGVKFKDYQAHKIQEYWIIDPEKQTLEQYNLNGNAYDLILKSSEGSVKSFVIDGFQIPVRAIFDEAENLKAIGGF